MMNAPVFLWLIDNSCVQCFTERQVDQEEWCTMWDGLAKGQSQQEWQEKYRDVVFSLIDTSGSIYIHIVGSISI